MGVKEDMGIWEEGGVPVWCESGRRVEGGRSESRSFERVGSGPFVEDEGVGVRGTCIYGVVSLDSSALMCAFAVCSFKVFCTASVSF